MTGKTIIIPRHMHSEGQGTQFVRVCMSDCVQFFTALSAIHLIFKSMLRIFMVFSIYNVELFTETPSFAVMELFATTTPFHAHRQAVDGQKVFFKIAAVN